MNAAGLVFFALTIGSGTAFAGEDASAEWIGVSSSYSAPNDRADEPALTQPSPVPDKSRIEPAFPIGDVRSRFAGHVQAAGEAAEVEPALIHAVIFVESGYNPSARSSQGAVGLMQLMPGTAKRYGVSNRLDPQQNIQGGTRYLSDLLRLFDNDLERVLAAYHAGEDTVLRYGRGIPPFRSTIAFVARVMTYYKRFRPSPQLSR